MDNFGNGRVEIQLDGQGRIISPNASSKEEVRKKAKLTFRCKDSEFKIRFKGDSPFDQRVLDSKNGKLEVSPRGDAVEDDLTKYAYSIEVGTEVLDPVIVVRPPT